MQQNVTEARQLIQRPTPDHLAGFRAQLRGKEGRGKEERGRNGGKRNGRLTLTHMQLVQ